MKASQHLILLLVVTMAPSLVVARETFGTCLIKTHPVKTCKYEWDLLKSECKYKCSDPPATIGPRPTTSPVIIIQPTTGGTSGGSSESRGQPYGRLLFPLDAQERLSLSAYRNYVAEAQAQGNLKASEWTIVKERNELDLYQSVLPKGVPMQAVPANVPNMKK